MKTRSKAFIALLSLAALTVPQSAAMAATTSFSAWYSEVLIVENNHQQYSMDLGAIGIGADADIVWADTTLNNYVSIDTPDSEEEWLNAATPFGKKVGSNWSDIEDSVFSVRSSTSSTIVITFSETIPANKLVWAISDIDVEQAVVTGSNTNGALSGSELAGFASPRSFNFCDVPSDVPGVCGGEDTVPRVTVNSGDVTAIPALESSDEGETAWGIVGADIDELVISPNVVDSSSGSVLIWLAYSDTAIADDPVSEGLATTGSSDSANLWMNALAITALIGVGGAVALRRRA
jgi:hypothetical protein